MARRRWRMTSAAGGLRHPEPQKWLKKYDSWFNVIEEWPSWSWNKKLASLTDRFMRFALMIWRWDMSVWSLFRGSWPQIGWNVAWWSLQIFLRKVCRTRRFSQRLSRVMSHGCLPTIRRRRCIQQSGTHHCLPDQRNHASSNPRKKWCSLHFLTLTVWCTMSSYHLDRLLMVISTCKFCRGCAMQFRGNGGTSGRESGFCITITFRATHRLLCSNSSPRKAFRSSPNHRTLRISLRVTFGCSLLWKWASRGRISQPWRTSNRMWRPNSGGFQKKPSTSASNNGRIDGTSVCVRKGPTLKVIR